MAKINFAFRTGATLKFNVYPPTGAAREENTNLPESPVSSTRYIAESSTVQEGDDVIVKEGTVPVGHGEYTKEGLTWLKNG